MITGWHRPTKIIVHTDRIIHNIQEQKKRLPKETEIYGVVKANGYGHGAVEVAKAALKAGVSGFCVSMLDEALQLRDAGITSPILVLNMLEPEYLHLASEHHLAITCGNEEWLQEVLAYLKENPLKEPVSLHLKIDSGMGRIGFFEKESLLKAYEEIKQANDLELEGIFTHFATADEEDFDYYNHQLQHFKALLEVIPVLPKYVHSSNSATALWHEAGVGNLVRMGISMYGLNPSGKALKETFPLQPALELESALIQVKEVDKGAKISYGKTYQAPETEWIGTIPIGYADGWLRGMQGFEVLVDGKKCPIVGRVCMDQLMILLPKKYPLGTKVTLIGENNGQKICAQDVADYLNTIHYEVCCQLSDRLPRVYQEK